MALFADATRIAAGGEDGDLVVLDAASGKVVDRVPLGAPMRSLAVSRMGYRLLVGTMCRRIRILDSETAADVTPAGLTPTGCTAVALAGNGSLLAVAREGRVDFSDAGSGGPRGSVAVGPEEVTRLLPTPDGRAIVGLGVKRGLAVLRPAVPTPAVRGHLAAKAPRQVASDPSMGCLAFEAQDSPGLLRRFVLDFRRSV